MFRIPPRQPQRIFLIPRDPQGSPEAGPFHGSAVAAPDVAAVQHVLDGGVDVDALRLAGDLDAVREGGDGAVRPTGAAVLGDVLVP